LTVEVAMFLLALFGCPTPAIEETSNLCGTIVRDADVPAATGVGVFTILDGEVPCYGDTGGGPGWWGDEVASPVPEGDFFQAEVPVGTYGVEVYTDSDYAGCAEVDVPDTTTCAADVSIELSEIVYADKPNVYLYPEVPTPVRVVLPAWKRITESEPRYPVDGWRAVAHPDGRLDTPVGPRDYFFYEMTWSPSRFQYEEGWCVPGRHAQASIEDAMADLGFLDNEIGDFADAWDATFPSAEWMTVYPQFDDIARLSIDPAPDNMLRAWFVVADGCQAVRAPQLDRVERVGYHGAEWGVTFLEPLDRPTVVVEGWR
jgi:hypothetical protein